MEEENLLEQLLGQIKTTEAFWKSSDEFWRGLGIFRQAYLCILREPEKYGGAAVRVRAIGEELMLVGYERGFTLESDLNLDRDLKRIFRAFDTTFSHFGMITHLREIEYRVQGRTREADYWHENYVRLMGIRRKASAAHV